MALNTVNRKHSFGTLMIFILLSALQLTACGSRYDSTRYDPDKAEHVFVTNVLSGDEIRISSSASNISLYGVDAPEVSQNYGPMAISTLKSLVMNKNVILLRDETTEDRRQVKILVDGRDVGLEMLRRGLAWVNPTVEDKSYRSAASTAQARKIGLWRDKNPRTPWSFRHTSKLHQAQLKKMRSLKFSKKYSGAFETERTLACKAAPVKVTAARDAYYNCLEFKLEVGECDDVKVQYDAVLEQYAYCL